LIYTKDQEHAFAIRDTLGQASAILSVSERPPNNGHYLVSSSLAMCMYLVKSRRKSDSWSIYPDSTPFMTSAKAANAESGDIEAIDTKSYRIQDELIGLLTELFLSLYRHARDAGLCTFGRRPKAPPCWDEKTGLGERKGASPDKIHERCG
jgi:hypothetical protein